MFRKGLQTPSGRGQASVVLRNHETWQAIGHKGGKHSRLSAFALLSVGLLFYHLLVQRAH